MPKTDPVETLYVSVEADIAKLLKDTAKGVDLVEKELGQIDKAVTQSERRFETLKKTIASVAKQTGASFKQAGKSIQEALSTKGIQVDTKEVDAAIKSLESDTKQAGLQLKDFADIGKQAIRAIGAVVGAVAAGIKLAMDAVRGLRIETSFRVLAASAGQSSDEILAAMQRASKGVVDDITLMQKANTALQLGVAKTPEDFDKLISSAIALGQAVGQDAVTSIDNLINAAGRGSKQVLDNLGLSIAEVNARMEKLAQLQYGLPVDKLDDAQRRLVMIAATLDAANEKAAGLKGNVHDLGVGGEQAIAGFKNVKQELSEILLLVFNLVNEGFAAFFGGEGIFARLTRGAKDWQRVLVQIYAMTLSYFTSIKVVLDQLFKGNLDVFDPGFFAEVFEKSFSQIMPELESKFAQVLDPEQYAEQMAAGYSPLEPIVEATEKDAGTINAILDRSAEQMMDTITTTNQQIEQLTQQHQDRIFQINQRYYERRDKAIADYETRRAELVATAAEQLADLADDTAKKRAETESEYRIEQERATEDYYREMRRLESQYQVDLTDAVKNRDARAIVDLRRTHKEEKQERAENFATQQQREKEDQQRRLRELQENEARRRREIEASLQKQLTSQKQAYQKQLQELAQNNAKQIAAENTSYQQRQAQLNQALAQRLQSIAKELADEEKIDREGARRILEALNETFGAGGDIDTLMEDFVKRRRQKMVLSINFQPSYGDAGSYTPTRRSGGGSPDYAGEYQHGGTAIAKRPTMALFGEAGPEMATFTPLAQGQMPQGLGRKTVDINLKVSGSAPPGIGRPERDQIAAVVLSAIRETGALT